MLSAEHSHGFCAYKPEAPALSNEHAHSTRLAALA